MSRWFRFYTAAIRDPKVASLSDGDYRLWTELLAVASDNDGLIPPLEALKRLLKRRSDHLYASVNRLVKGGLIDPVEGGFEPHNWRKYQYKSDSSTPRVKRFRNGGADVSVTPPDTDTDTETEKEDDKSSSERARASSNFAFCGRTVRLTDADLATWRKRYPGIPDIMAELTAIDDWFQSERGQAKRRTWFQTTSGALNRKHQEAIAAKREAVSADAFWG